MVNLKKVTAKHSKIIMLIRKKQNLAKALEKAEKIK